MGTILDEIVAAKRHQVARAKAACPLGDLKARVRDAAPPRDFYGALASPPALTVHVIAEIKRKSPSAGLIRPNFDPIMIAENYQQAGASCLSVLTDGPYFDGRLEYVQQVKSAVPMPVLRKDFMVDAYQIYESRAAGADCVLLIGEVLPPAQLRALLDLSFELGMTSLIEVHEQATLEAVQSVVAFPNDRRGLLGINNRNLKIQKTDLSTTEQLAGMVSPNTFIVAESGVRTREDVQRLVAAGARAILIGETLMAAPDISSTMNGLFGRDSEF